MATYLRLLLIAGLLMSFSSGAYAQEHQSVVAQHSSPESARQQVQNAFDAWLAAVSSGSSDAVVKLYAKDAVLLPTFSPKVHNTPALIKEYFDVFTAHPDLKGTMNEEHIRILGHIAINSGLYTFTYTKDGQTVVVPARFSFIYHQTPEGWLIIDHHSSKLPDAH